MFHNPVKIRKRIHIVLSVHPVELPGAQDEMGEFRRADRARYRGEMTGRGNIVHWILLSQGVANSGASGRLCSAPDKLKKRAGLADLVRPHCTDRGLSRPRSVRNGTGQAEYPRSCRSYVPRPAIPCSELAQQRHNIIRKRVALVSEERECWSPARHCVGSTRRTHRCASTSLAMTESPSAVSRRRQ
jgi:hypothetical protein